MRLLNEHADLQARLEPFRCAVRDLAVAGPEQLAVVLPTFREGARILTTDLIAHARREDEAFFPAVEEAIGGTFGPTIVLREEHVTIQAGADQFRATLNELQAVQHPAIVEGGARLHGLVEGKADAGALRELGTSLLSLVDDHFAKEEQILFPMARSILDAEGLQSIALRMDALDGA